ncbi:phosphoribosylglycinamide formyltransferase [Candidatus Woesearchaeota archaeon]|nr:phosphoribosylglycinamide formyltransferase [Candidatus Woesearchaeota archaeon]
MVRDNIRLGYMASGGGSSVEALATKIASGQLHGYESSVILCNNSPGKAGIWERGEKLGIPVVHTPSSDHQLETLLEYNPDLVLGLGWVKLVKSDLLNAFEDRVLNIHPTLLPKYGGDGMYGLRTHMAVLNSGDTHTGATVHLMNSVYDDGKILRQVTIPVPDHLIGNPSEKNAQELQQRVLKEEYALIPVVLERIRDGDLETGLELIN